MNYNKKVDTLILIEIIIIYIDNLLICSDVYFSKQGCTQEFFKRRGV